MKYSEVMFCYAMECESDLCNDAGLF